MAEAKLRLRGTEQLEPRRVLDGVVLVDLVGGNLVIQGDAEANVVAVDNRLGRFNTKVALVITPGPTTSINNLPAGEVLRLPAVQLQSVKILPGEGNDQISVRNLSIAGDLNLDDPDGGKFAFATSTAKRGFLKIGDDGATEDKGGRDKWIEIQSFSFRGGLKVESSLPLDLSIQKTTAASLGGYLKLDGVPGEVAEAGSRIRLAGLKLSGDLRVTSEGGSLSMKAVNSSARGGFLTLGGSDGGTSAKGHKAWVDIQSFSFRGGLKVESSMPLDLSIQKTTAAALGGYLKLDGIPGEVSASSIRLSGLKLAGALRVRSEGGPVELKIVASKFRSSEVSIGSSLPAPG
jgi:hypothetical protein